MHIPKEKKKLDEKSLRCILLEYSNKSKGYKPMDSTTWNIYISKYIIFDETRESSISILAKVPKPNSGPIINHDDERETPIINLSLNNVIILKWYQKNLHDLNLSIPLDTSTSRPKIWSMAHEEVNLILMNTMMNTLKYKIIHEAIKLPHWKLSI